MPEKYLLQVDGSLGEGGGQVLRSTLALSMALGRPFRIHNIRGNRAKPGLRRQHLTCVHAAQAICGAEVNGADFGSLELSFLPGPVRPGNYTFDIGSGGSVTLVLQALIPPLLTTAEPSRLTVIGGTHVPKAPVFEFMQKTLFPRLEQLGPRLRAELLRPGFSRLGGGRVEVEIAPIPRLGRLDEVEPGTLDGAEARIFSHNLPEHISAREKRILEASQTWGESGFSMEAVRIDSGWSQSQKPEGSGNAVIIEVRRGGRVSIFSEVAERGRKAEDVAANAARHTMRFVQDDIPICEHLADQLIVPLALAGGGRFLTQKVTPHTRTCLAIAELFTGLKGRLTTLNQNQNLVELGETKGPAWRERERPATWRRFGEVEPKAEAAAITQMVNACRLPIVVRGALMPDAHVGYGFPIGGVLAVKKALIPYAVGLDIGCRMRLTILDWPPASLHDDRWWQLMIALKIVTCFGLSAYFGPWERREHEVMDDDWSFSPVTIRLKNRAWEQLGTSGGGNHFVEFGDLYLPASDLGLPAGSYLALLSHSGSRDSGEEVAKYYSRLAMGLRPGLPPEIMHLAWLEENSELGREYWAAMELMGRYAAANHELIHRHILAVLGAEALVSVETHHNFAWREEHDGEEVIVHRKGAIPAHRSQLGLITGSMASPGFVVRGRGHPEALASCSHGAGRRLSRAAAFKTLDLATIQAILADRGVEVSGSLDEAPVVYKNIEEIMAAQADLVEVVACFEPRLVEMAYSHYDANTKRELKKNLQTTRIPGLDTQTIFQEMFDRHLHTVTLP